MPEFLERRYSVGCRECLVIMSLFLYIFTKVSATLFAGQILLEEVTHMNKWAAACLLIVGTALYTCAGGLAAVIYTEVLQTAVLLVGGMVLMVLCLQDVGGMDALQEQVPDSYFKLLRPADHPLYPWPGLTIGYFLMSSWYWACDQVTVQRVLAAKNVAHGQAACVFAAYLKVHKVLYPVPHLPIIIITTSQ
jgi:SSS family solute:Na+ symporter